MNHKAWLCYTCLIAFGALLVLPATSDSQVSLKAEAGYTGVESLNAIGLNLGAGWTFNRLRVTATPVDVFFVSNSKSEFSTQVQSNGQTVCRNTSNGQYATSSSCAPQGYYAGQADVMAEFGRPNTPIGVGGGYRVGYSHGVPNAAYGSFTIGHRVDRITYFSRGNVGANFIQFNVGVSLNVGATHL